MAEDGRRTSRPAPGSQQELPPPPRLVQYGVPPARQSASREGGGVAAPYLPIREDQPIREHLETERRQQLAHSIQLLQQKAARQQRARMGIVRCSAVPLSTGGAAPGQGAVTLVPARLVTHRPPAVTGNARRSGAGRAVGGVQVVSGSVLPPAITLGGPAAAAAGRPAGNGGSSTAGRPAGNEGSPTAGRPAGNGGSPTAGRSAGNGGSSTAGRPAGNGGSPAAGRPAGNSGSPAAGRPAGNSGSPAAGRPAGNGGSPAAGRPAGNGGLSTAGRPAGNGGSPPGTRVSPPASAAPTPAPPAGAHAETAGTAGRSPKLVTTGATPPKPPAPTDIEMRNGADGGERMSSMKSHQDKSEEMAAPSADCQGGVEDGTPAKRASPPVSEEAEPAAKRVRLDADSDGTSAAQAASAAASPAAASSPVDTSAAVAPADTAAATPPVNTAASSVCTPDTSSASADATARASASAAAVTETAPSAAVTSEPAASETADSSPAVGANTDAPMDEVASSNAVGANTDAPMDEVTSSAAVRANTDASKDEAADSIVAMDAAPDPASTAAVPDSVPATNAVTPTANAAETDIMEAAAAATPGISTSVVVVTSTETTSISTTTATAVTSTDGTSTSTTASGTSTTTTTATAATATPTATSAIATAFTTVIPIAANAAATAITTATASATASATEATATPSVTDATASTNATPIANAATTAVIATSAATATATATAAIAIPTHKGKKSWLAYQVNTGESAESPTSSDSGTKGGGGDGGEKSANDTPAQAAAKSTSISSSPEEEMDVDPVEVDNAASTEEDGKEMDMTPPGKVDNAVSAEDDGNTAVKMGTISAETESSPSAEEAGDMAVKMETISTEMEGSPAVEEGKPNGAETPAEAESQDAPDGSSSGEGDSTANGAEEPSAVLGPRAAAAATKAAAAVKKSPGRPRKKPVTSPAAGGPKRPSVAALKKSGESFTQTNFCCQILNKLPRCRECRAVPMQRHNKPTSIYCRFTAFRKVRYTRNGQLSVTGFCDPYSDADGEFDRLWRANPDGPPTMEPEIAKFLLAHVGNQFCDLVTEEEAARRCHMSEDQTVAWKRVVRGCREMCDVCETTLFNVHWVCSRCGFAVCVDCYRGRKDGTAKDWGEPLAERDQYRWLLCGPKPHQQEKLVLTQIVTGDALQTLNRQVHEARQMASLPLTCDCEVAKRLQKEAGEGAAAAGGGEAAVKAEPGLGAARVKTEGSGGAVGGGTQKPASTTLSFLADVALSKIASDDSDSSDSDDSDAGGGSLALRRLLVPGTQAETKPKPVKKERPPDRPKRSGWSMGDSLDEVLDKVSARCTATAPASHTASGPAALQHFVRRSTSKRGFRERLPIRIMTLGESTRLYPNVRHSWLCDGKLLRLHEAEAPDSVRLFRDQWKRGQPVICSGIGGGLDRKIWSVEAFIRDFGDVRNDLINCRTGNIVPNQPMRRFWEGFECVTRRLRDDKGQPMILKLKDWPPGEDFADMMPQRFDDLMSVLPMTDYTRRDGRLNLASCLPDIFVRPDLGPKMYIAYGCALHPSKASTNLHLDVSDAVNIMVYVGIPPDGDADNAEALRAIDEAGCDQLTKRRVKDEMPGALWHIYHAADADKIRDLLNKIAIERGDQLEPHHDPIHDQSWYLDGPLRRRLYEEYRVEGYPIVQCAGDAVFIPAGAPHQVRNLHSCIKVAEDFVSPENIGHCFDLTQEFRSLSDTHTNHEDKLQIKNIIYHAMKDAVSCLLGVARPASTAAAGAGTAAGDGKPAADGGKPAADGGKTAAAGPVEAGIDAGAVRVKTEPAI